MSFALTDDEWEILSRVPTEDLVQLAAELDLLVPEQVDGRTLVNLCVPLIVERGRRHHLPFSKYDLDDLRELSAADLAVLAEVQGLTPRATVQDVLKVGERAYRSRQSGRNRLDPFAYMIPILLTPIVRCATTHRAAR